MQKYFDLSQILPRMGLYPPDTDAVPRVDFGFGFQTRPRMKRPPVLTAANVDYGRGRGEVRVMTGPTFRGRTPGLK